MIRIRQLTLARGGRVLLNAANASIATAEKIALIGPNGSGKSTLLDAICGAALIESGEIDLAPMRIVRLSQHAPSGGACAWQWVQAGDDELTAARAEEAAARESGDAARIAEAHERLADLNAASAEARAMELLAGLGFSHAQARGPIDSLSGGWRVRLNLARALFVASELLLLDEPTNHLDLDAIVWFERWLTRYPGTAIVVSHDRDFLDRVAQATLSIEDAALVRYAGGYSAFESQRAQRIEHAARAQAAQRERVAHLTAFIERFRAKATKARQVQSRIKALERMVAIAPARLQRGVDFTLADIGDSPDPLVVAEGLAAGYEERAVLSGVELTVSRGARIGVLGRNGAGKSTLIRTLVGDLAPLAGECRRARSIRVGYFAQHGVDDLDPRDSPLAFLQRLDPQAKESALRDELGRYGFSGEDALRALGPMSGGEKARLVLAAILRTRPHLLVLDEPTNHLDALTRDALADALSDYDGALLLVSHDRYLLRSSVDSFLIVRDGQAGEFDGDLDDYLAWLQRGDAPEARARAAGGDEGPARNDRRQERRDAAARRLAIASLVGPIDHELARVELQLAAAERRLARIERELADPELYRDATRPVELARERGILVRERDEMESRWLELSEAREARVLAFEREASG